MESSVKGAFPDVPADLPFAGAIARASDLGIMTGFPDGTFHPDGGVLGEDFGVMVGEALVGRPVPHDTLGDIAQNPVLEIESDEPITRLRAVIVVVNAMDDVRPGLIPDVPGILERLREIAGDTREVARARDAGLLATLFDYWSDQVGRGTPPAEPPSLADLLEQPMPRAEVAQLLVNLVGLV